MAGDASSRQIPDSDEMSSCSAISKTFRPHGGDPRSVYVHIPFCRHRCGYCNFTLVAGRDYLIERFLNALEKEVSWLDRSYEFETLFIGGGTPSHLSPSQIEQLSGILSSRFKSRPGAEITAECNPNDLDKPRMAALSQLGVNRISLGAQSLNPVKLKRLERDHAVDDVRNAIAIARLHGASVSLDLIFAAPEETLDQWNHDLESAIALKPDHLSTYELTYEKGTQFWNRLNRGLVGISDEDLRADMYTSAIERLAAAGFRQYEVSSFARANHKCRHNLAYWIGDPFFAFGPGAARFVDGIRETNHSSTMQYLKLVEAGTSPVADTERLDSKHAAKERLAIGLRMTEGINESDFLNRTGISVSDVLGNLQSKLIEHALLERIAEPNVIWRLTSKGQLICDWIAGEIVA